MGQGISKDMDGFIEFLNVEIPKIFESKEYEDHKSRIIAEYEKARESLFTG